MLNEHILNANGWTVDCYSPAEISHEDGSTATGQAVYMVVSYLCQAAEDDDRDDYEDEDEEDLEFDGEE